MHIYPSADSYLFFCNSPAFTGVFQFFFWRLGEWVEVLVDDRLPTHEQRMFYEEGAWGGAENASYFRFLRNRANENEFWPCLVEKAYAKYFRFKINICCFDFKT